MYFGTCVFVFSGILFFPRLFFVNSYSVYLISLLSLLERKTGKYLLIQRPDNNFENFGFKFAVLIQWLFD